MIGFLSFIILLAIAKIQAVTPDPHVNTCCTPVLTSAYSKILINSSLSLNVWSDLLIHARKPWLNESSYTQIGVEGTSDDSNTEVDSDAAYPSSYSTQDALGDY